MHGGRGDTTTRRPPRPIAFVPFAAKLTPPTLDAPLVERSRLADRYAAFDGRQVVLSAPAGYGKSILAAQLLASDPRPGAWLALDDADNDPFLLTVYLTLALGTVEPIADDRTDRLTRADLELDHLVGELVDVLAGRTRPFVLVLDDAHRLVGPSRELVLGALVDNAPPGSTVVLTTRAEPPFPASRSAMHGDLLVLDAAALAMDESEAGILLCNGGVATDAETVALVQSMAEGWPAGLYLTALALRDAEDPGRAARALSGRHRPIADFFAEEVLPALDAADVEFLLATSPLDRCSGSLCDTALGQQGSGARLERLARTNRFVVPLDDTGDWYRYHHLFADMLRGEQRRRDAAAFAAVAGRASDWWEQQFEPDAAIALALTAGDRVRAVDLIGRFAPILQNTRRVPTVARWLSAFPDEEIAATPALAVTAAWNALMEGDAAGVHRFATAVEQHADDTTLPDGTPPAAAVALLVALTTTRGLTAVRDHAARAYAGHPAHSPYLAVAAMLEGQARAWLGDWDGARARSDDAIRIGRVGLVAAQVHGLATRARIDAAHDDWASARAGTDDALALIDDQGFAERPAMASVYAIAALVDARAASPHADARWHHAVGLLERLEDVTPFVAAGCLLELAEAAILSQRVDDATTLLGEADRRLRRLGDTGLLPFALARVGAQLAASSRRPADHPVERLSPAEERVLRYLPTHLSFGEIGDELFVSRNTVKSHAMAIYRKLGATSRSGAVREAVARGLLPAESPSITPRG